MSFEPNLEILDSPASTLGEGLYIGFDYVAWVDIVGKKVFLYRKKLIHITEISYTPSLIVRDSDFEILIICDVGILKMNIENLEIEEVFKYEGFFDNEEYRTNDGCLLSDGTLIIGYMHKKYPEKFSGGLIKITNFSDISNLDIPISIPNSFIVNNNFIYITDSLFNTIKKYEINREFSLNFIDNFYTNKSGYSPDGGCVIREDLLALATWDGACIELIDTEGKLKDQIKLPVLRPTNCKYSSLDDCMWITSAKEGLDNSQLEQYPLSGKTLKLNNFLKSQC